MDACEVRVIFRVGDFGESVRFYADLLGMERVTSWDRGEGPGIILRAGDGRTVELFGPPPGQDHADRLASGVELGMRVRDVDGWHDRLRAAGVAIARGLVDTPWGDRSFGIDDPAGVRIWLFEVTGTGQYDGPLVPLSPPIAVFRRPEGRGCS